MSTTQKRHRAKGGLRSTKINEERKAVTIARSLACNDVNASYTSKSDRRKRESTNLDVDRNTDIEIPAGALNAFENDLDGAEKGWGGTRGYKGLESRLVENENDKKFIRRSVGRRAAATSLASCIEKKEEKKEDGEKKG